MIDNVYRNAFKEVSDILKNTDEELINKIPHSFINFIESNMNSDYPTNINPNMDIDKQPLLKETEGILSLIYRSYWATEEEKKQFEIKDKEELLKNTKQIQYKSVEEIFKKKQNLDNITINNNSIIVYKENFLSKVLNKLKTLFKRR